MFNVSWIFNLILILKRKYYYGWIIKIHPVEKWVAVSFINSLVWTNSILPIVKKVVLFLNETSIGKWRNCCLNKNLKTSDFVVNVLKVTLFSGGTKEGSLAKRNWRLRNVFQRKRNINCKTLCFLLNGICVWVSFRNKFSSF